MRKIETAVLGVTLGAVPVIACFLTGWWASIPFVAESSIWKYALIGLVAGILVDALFLARWMRCAYSMKPWIWMVIYGFYSTGMLGFFMGVPVFNLLLALPAGLFVGRWLAYMGADSTHVKKVTRQAARFTAGVLATVCLASASVALVADSTASDLQGLLALPFAVTQWMLIGLIVCGGAMLLMLDWWFTTRCVRHAYEYFRAHDEPRSV